MRFEKFNEQELSLIYSAMKSQMASYETQKDACAKYASNTSIFKVEEEEFEKRIKVLKDLCKEIIEAMMDKDMRR